MRPYTGYVNPCRVSLYLSVSSAVDLPHANGIEAFGEAVTTWAAVWFHVGLNHR